MTCADLQHHREVLNRASRSTNAIADRHAGEPNSRSAPTVVTLRAGKSTLGPWFAPRVTTLDPMTAADSTRPSKASRNRTPSRPCTTAKRKPVTRQVSSTPSAWTRVRPRSSASSSTHQVGRSQSWISRRRGRPDDGSDASAFERVTWWQLLVDPLASLSLGRWPLALKGPWTVDKTRLDTAAARMAPSYHRNSDVVRGCALWCSDASAVLVA